MSGLSLKEICFVSIIGGEERGERCFLQITVRFICQETAEQYKPFPPPPPSPPPLSLHLFIPLLSKCSSIQLPQIIL